MSKEIIKNHIETEIEVEVSDVRVFGRFSRTEPFYHSINFSYGCFEYETKNKDGGTIVSTGFFVDVNRTKENIPFCERPRQTFIHDSIASATLHFLNLTMETVNCLGN